MRSPISARSQRLERWFVGLGLLPYAVFTLVHALHYCVAAQRGDAFPRAEPQPLLRAAEVVLVLLPLLVFFGFLMASAITARADSAQRAASADGAQDGSRAGWSGRVARLGAFVCAALILLHLDHVWSPLARGSRRAVDVPAALRDALSSASENGVPVVAIAYLLGCAAICAHLVSAALWATRGLAERRRRRAERAAFVVGLMIFGLCAASILIFATGSVWS